MKYAVYEPDTGLIAWMMSADGPPPDPPEGLAQIAVEDWVEQHDVYISDGAPVMLPPSPGDWAVWDGTQWTDPRSIADLAAELDRRRDRAALPKADFLLALVSAGILSADEAEQAAGGAIPASFVPLVDSWPAEARLAARVKWRADATISRNNPLIIAASEFLGLDPIQLDAIFGLGATE